MKALFRPGPKAAGGQRFTLCHEPSGPRRGLVVAVHPFAEEFNKSRRMMSLAGHALARHGYVVVVTDLLGCGDSSGNLDEASWDAWIDDIEQAADWARSEYGELPLTLWGIRAGCLLATQASVRIGGECRFLFWQPQLSGRQALQQFLRLKMAGLIQDGPVKGVTEGLVRDLDAGLTVEVAGYRLGPGVAKGLAAAQLGVPPARPASSVTWLEVSSQDPPGLLPVSSAAVERWRAAGYEVRAGAVKGPLFWQTLWVEDAPELIERTVEVMTTTPDTVAA